MAVVRDVEIKDFGQKIGGARKDLASKRGIYLDAISNLSNRELLEFVTKDRVWVKPKYNSDEYKDFDEDYLLFLHYLRSQLPSKMQATTFKKIEDIYGDLKSNSILTPLSRLYCIFLQSVRDFFENPDVYRRLKDIRDGKKDLLSRITVNTFNKSMNVLSEFDSFFRQRASSEILGMPDYVSDFLVMVNSRDNNLLADLIRVSRSKLELFVSITINDHKKNNLVYNIGNVGGHYNNLGSYISGSSFYEAKLHNFPENFQSEFKNTIFAIYNDSFGKKYADKPYIYIDFGNSKMRNIYPNRDAGEGPDDLIQRANKKLAELQAKKASENKSLDSEEGKIKVKRPQVEWVNRTLQPILNRPVEEQDYLDKFKLFGGEFGNWNNQKDRQAFLNYGYEAFSDLAFALDVKPWFIGLPQIDLVKKNKDYEALVKTQTKYRNLSIAFGARGKSFAMAHFEPERNVINLTKLKGAGSLAHEFGHALDAYLCNSLGRIIDMLLDEHKEKKDSEIYKHTFELSTIRKDLRNYKMFSLYFDYGRRRYISLLVKMIPYCPALEPYVLLGLKMMNILKEAAFNRITVSDEVRNKYISRYTSKFGTRYHLIASILLLFEKLGRTKDLKKESDWLKEKQLIIQDVLSTVKDNDEMVKEAKRLMDDVEDSVRGIVDGLSKQGLEEVSGRDLHLSGFNDAYRLDSTDSKEIEEFLKENAPEEEATYETFVKYKKKVYQTIFGTSSLFDNIDPVNYPLITAYINNLVDSNNRLSNKEKDYIHYYIQSIVGYDSEFEDGFVGIFENIIGLKICKELNSTMYAHLMSLYGKYDNSVVFSMKGSDFLVDRRKELNFEDLSEVAEELFTRRSSIEKTYFYSNLEFFSNSAYLKDRAEIFARLFEFYIQSYFTSIGVESNYLVYGTKETLSLADNKNALKSLMNLTSNRNRNTEISIYPLDKDDVAKLNHLMMDFISSLSSLRPLFGEENLAGFDYSLVTLNTDGQYSRALDEAVQATSKNQKFRELASGDSIQTALQHNTIKKTDGNGEFNLDTFFQAVAKKTKNTIIMARHYSLPENYKMYKSQAGVVDSKTSSKAWKIWINGNLPASVQREGALEYLTLLLLNGSVPSIQEAVPREKLGEMRDLYMYAFSYFFDKESAEKYSSHIGETAGSADNWSFFEELIHKDFYKWMLRTLKSAL